MRKWPLADVVCDRARLARDARFDGLFFTGVKTTGIYCRPVCPVRPARTENVVFFPSAAAAAADGFRPCLRCRPEAAPGTPAWAGSTAVVRRALRLIDEGLLDRGGADELADAVGLGDRHLRRLFRRHLGASPTQVARTRRLHFAKQLIDETDLSMTEVSMASGFGSVRRFNDAFLSVYGRSPSQLRKSRRSSEHPLGERPLELRLAFRRPFDWSGFCDLYRREAIAGVEEVSGERLSCALPLPSRTVLLEARLAGGGDFIVLHLSEGSPLELPLAVAAARRVLDLDANPGEIGRSLGALERTPGQRLPGVFNPFAYLVRSVIASHHGEEAATSVPLELVRRSGSALPSARPEAFPGPAELAGRSFRGLGLSRACAAALRRLVRHELESPTSLCDVAEAESLAAALSTFLGASSVRFSRHVAMRISGDPDAFASTPCGAGTTPTPGSASPWSSYAYLASCARGEDVVGTRLTATVSERPSIRARG